MQNMLLEEVKYKVVETRSGTWRRHMSPAGMSYAEFKSKATFLGLPLLHYTSGLCPETGRHTVARGVVAVGRLACGVLAVGHASFGLIAVGQLAVGLLFGLGQAATGLAAIGQAALGVVFGLGQLATGSIAIGQFAFGRLVLAQKGVGAHVWCMGRADPEAVAFFKHLLAGF